MKLTHTTTAQFLLLLAACMPAAAQKQTGPDPHQVEAASPVSRAFRADNAQITSLQLQLTNYQEQLTQKAQRVEEDRQQAISAGIESDGAGPLIQVYLQEQKELDSLQAALAPKIENVQRSIADVNRNSSNVSSLGGAHTPF